MLTTTTDSRPDWRRRAAIEEEIASILTRLHALREQKRSTTDEAVRTDIRRGERLGQARIEELRLQLKGSHAASGYERR